MRGECDPERRQVTVSTGLSSLNNFGRLWSTGMVSSCLAPGPGVI